MTPDNSTPLSLREQIEHDLANAESSGEDVKAAALRLAMCAIHDRDAEARASDQCDGCEDTAIRDVLEIMVRQRAESAARYEAAGRIETADREREEMEVIAVYLPQPLAGEELIEAVSDVIDDLEAKSLKDLGRCMSELKTRFPDQIDTKKAGKAVKAALG